MQRRRQPRPCEPGNWTPLSGEGLLEVGEELIWDASGVSHRAVVMSGGALQSAGGRILSHLRVPVVRWSVPDHGWDGASLPSVCRA
jgi:hypothetical protein